MIIVHRQSISTYFVKPASPKPKRKHSPAKPVRAVSSTADEPIDIDEFDDDDLSIQYLTEPEQKKPRLSTNAPLDVVSSSSTDASSTSATKSVDSFFSKNGKDKNAAQNRRALAIQQAMDARGSSARKALQKFKLSDDIKLASSLPSGVAFDDYHVSATQATAGAELSEKEDKDGAAEDIASHAAASQLQKKRHDAWQKRLQDPSGLIPRRRSLNLDEAEAREARAALAAARGEEYVPDADEGDLDLDGGGDLGGIDSPAESISASRTKHTKAAATKPTKGKGKKKEEVGPSGLPYTPLEKQVCPLARRRGNLLME